MKKLHPEIMTSDQAALLARLGPFASERGFYLGGGSAVALQLGHRMSVDLDFFAPDEPRDPLLLRSELDDVADDLVTRSAGKGTLHLVADGVQLTFLRYRYPLLSDPVAAPDLGCDLASLEDLAAMKLAAISQRGLRRDFYDIHALLESDRTLHELLGAYRKKYNINDIAHLLTSLVWFKDADPDHDPKLLKKYSWEDVKKSIQQKVLHLAG